MAAAAGQLLTFDVAGRSLALPAAQVREVIRRGRLTAVPQAPASLLGLANVRGTAMPVICCAALIDRLAGSGQSVIILEGMVPVGLAVDTVHAVLTAEQSAAEPIDIFPLIAEHFAALAGRPARRGERVATRRSHAEAAIGFRILSFAVGSQDFALPLDLIEAVIALPSTFASLPRADDAVLGTAAWRDGLLPLFSLAALLGLPSADGVRRRVIIARIAGHAAGFVVDEIHEVITAEDDMIDPLPPVLARGGAEARIAGIVRLDGGRRLLSLLSPMQLLNEEATACLRDEGRMATRPLRQVVEAAVAVLLLVIGGQRYGLPLTAVDEVARLPTILTRLPRAPNFVRGVMQARGRALAVIDQGARFGAVSQGGQRVVIARAGKLEAAFLVDTIVGVIRVPQHMISMAPSVGTEPQIFETLLIEGEDEPITLLLSPFALLNGAQNAFLASFADSGAAPRP